MCLKCPKCLLKYYKYLGTCTHCSALRPVAASCGFGQFGYINSPWWYCKPWNNKTGKGSASSARNVSCNISGTRALVNTAAHCGLLRPRAALANLVITTLLGGIASLGPIKLGRLVPQVPEMSRAILQVPGHLYTLQRIAALDSCGLGQFGYNNSPWWHCKPWNRKMGKGCASSSRNVSCNITGTRALVHTAAHCVMLQPRAALANLVITALLGGIASLGTGKWGRVVPLVPEMSSALLQVPGHLYTLQRIAACCGLVRLWPIWLSRLSLVVLQALEQ